MSIEVRDIIVGVRSHKGFRAAVAMNHLGRRERSPVKESRHHVIGGISVDRSAAWPPSRMDDPMATETITRLIDDLDGTKAERTIEFAMDGHTYEIDLSRKNIRSLEKVLAPYIAAARRTKAPRTRNRRPRAATTSPARPSRDLSAVREWARQNGFEVNTRGRVAAEISTAYDAAH